MNNVSIGNKVETDICAILRKYHYWAYNCPKNLTGAQPVDIIAYRGGEVKMFWLIDGKHIREQNASFTLGRVEDNQIMSMTYAVQFAEVNPDNIGFVVYFERTKQFYWLPYVKVSEMLKNDVKSVNLKNLELFEEVLR